MSQSLADPVLSRLEAELEPWPRLLVIADRLEELGEDRLAWGYTVAGLPWRQVMETLERLDALDSAKNHG